MSKNMVLFLLVFSLLSGCRSVKPKGENEMLVELNGIKELLLAHINGNENIIAQEVTNVESMKRMGNAVKVDGATWLMSGWTVTFKDNAIYATYRESPDSGFVGHIEVGEVNYTIVDKNGKLVIKEWDLRRVRVEYLERELLDNETVAGSFNS